jgi:hypothetical protein
MERLVSLNDFIPTIMKLKVILVFRRNFCRYAWFDSLGSLRYFAGVCFRLTSGFILTVLVTIKEKLEWLS